jgi:hypothetical protein
MPWPKSRPGGASTLGVPNGQSEEAAFSATNGKSSRQAKIFWGDLRPYRQLVGSLQKVPLARWIGGNPARTRVACTPLPSCDPCPTTITRRSQTIRSASMTTIGHSARITLLIQPERRRRASSCHPVTSPCCHENIYRTYSGACLVTSAPAPSLPLPTRR